MNAQNGAVRVRRSLIITPGDRIERMRKALTLDADCVVFDLEDGVSSANKDDARANIRQLLVETDTPHIERMVRPGAIADGQFSVDVEALPLDRLDALFVPKVESPEQAREIDRLLAPLENAAGRSTPLPVILSIETPTAVFDAREIALSCERAEGLFFGSGDYAAITGIEIAEHSLLWPRAQIQAAAASAGLEAIDAAWFVDVKNSAATERDAVHARSLGYSGKLVFHPDQIAVANVTFTPSPEALARARRLIDAFEAASADGAGTIMVGDEFVAVDILPPLRRQLALVEAIERKQKLNPGNT